MIARFYSGNAFCFKKQKTVGEAVAFFVAKSKKLVISYYICYFFTDFS